MKKFRVAEIFGPTVQGEGRHVGIPCHFIRFGGCDYRCTWCDSLHAVLPDQVRLLPRLTEDEIIEQLVSLPDSAKWVVYSGGNPALLDLGGLTIDLRSGGYKVMVETQGTMYKPWLQWVDELCISPKGPSAQVGTHAESLNRLILFMGCEGVLTHKSVYFKIPIFSEADYAFARAVRGLFPQVEMFLSVGNPLPPPVGMPDNTSRTLLRETILARTEELVNRVLREEDEMMQTVRIFPQQHVLIWGNTRGK